MKFTRFFLLVVLNTCFVTISLAQRVNINNGFTVQLGVSSFDIVSNNFISKSDNGFVLGASTVVDLPHKWYTVSYEMLLSEQSIELIGKQFPEATSVEMIPYKLMMAQLGFLFHIKILNNNLMIELGPQIQYNGKLELKNGALQSHIISGYNSLTALDISNISRFNVNSVIGFTVGTDIFKIRAHYSYGITNILNHLNSKNFKNEPQTTEFYGHQSLYMLTAMFMF